MNNKAIVIYYSLSGNTKKIAELIKDKTGADIEEIQTLTPYTGDYNSIVEQGHKEINNGYKPKIKQISAEVNIILLYSVRLYGGTLWLRQYLHFYLKTVWMVKRLSLLLQMEDG